MLLWNLKCHLDTSFFYILVAKFWTDATICSHFQFISKYRYALVFSEHQIPVTEFTNRTPVETWGEEATYTSYEQKMTGPFPGMPTTSIVGASKMMHTAKSKYYTGKQKYVIWPQRRLTWKEHAYPRTLHPFLRLPPLFFSLSYAAESKCTTERTVTKYYKAAWTYMYSFSKKHFSSLHFFGRGGGCWAHLTKTSGYD